MIFYFSSFLHDLHNPRPQQLDHDRMSILSLRNKFKKDKFLSKQPACEAAVSSELQLPHIEDAEKSKAASVVESRFLSSKILAKEVDRVLQSFRALLGGGTAAGDVSPTEGDGEWGGFADANLKSATKGKQKKGSKQTAAGEASDANDGSDVEQDELQYSSNFEGEEGEADGWESGSINEDDTQSVLASSDNSDDESDGEASGSVHASSDADAPPKKPKKLTKQKPSTAAENSNPTSGSTFLPSLAVGFIRGDSDSEWSDGEAAAGDLPQRKNRRGQRARKAIWEKKYGKNANHIKKQQEQETLSMAYVNAGRGRGRGRGGSQAGRGRGHEAPPSYGFGRGRGGDGPSNANAAGGVPAQVPSFARSNEYQYTERKVATADKPMHPSWEAKKRLREKQTAAIVPTQGTRITFS